MAGNVTQEFLLEHFRALRGDIAHLKDEMRFVRGDLNVLRQHVGGLVQSDLARDDRFVTIEERISRLERRLELSSGDS
ncbi:MAG: hypothetical protein ACU0DW_01375 [Shimia sp.]